MTTVRSHDTNHSMLERVRGVLVALEIPGLTADVVEPHANLLELGLDSVSFAELTLGLEEALGVERFPMQEWVDDQMAANRPLSVESLVAACGATVGAEAHP